MRIRELFIGMAFLGLSQGALADSLRPLDHPANARLKAALAKRGASVPSPVTAPTISNGASEATLFPNLTATTDRGGRVAYPGPRGNYRTRPTDAYIALPAFGLEGVEVLVRCACSNHPGGRGPAVSLPIHDVGPWSRFDPYILENRRPLVESGKSDTYRKVPKSAPAVDLTPQAWRLLGHEPGKSIWKAENYSGVVDLIVIRQVVPRKDAPPRNTFARSFREALRSLRRPLRRPLAQG